MADDLQRDVNARAAELVRRASEEEGESVSNAELGPIVAAVAEDLPTVSADAAVAEERLVKLEIQTRVLADAVIAITNPADNDPGAVSADAIVAEERLEKVETQTRVLSEAVIAINETISETPDTLAPAVQAVKDEM
jgi:hypothetical protein